MKLKDLKGDSSKKMSGGLKHNKMGDTEFFFERWKNKAKLKNIF